MDCQLKMFFPVKPGSLELYSSAGINIAQDGAYFKSLATQLAETKPAFAINLKPVQKPSLQTKRGFFITPIRCIDDIRYRHQVRKHKGEQIGHRESEGPKNHKTKQSTKVAIQRFQEQKRQESDSESESDSSSEQ